MCVCVCVCVRVCVCVCVCGCSRRAAHAADLGLQIEGLADAVIPASGALVIEIAAGAQARDLFVVSETGRVLFFLNRYGH